MDPFDDTPNHPEEDEFLDELQRRSREVDQGTAELIPWSTLRDMAE